MVLSVLKDRAILVVVGERGPGELNGCAISMDAAATIVRDAILLILKSAQVLGVVKPWATPNQARFQFERPDAPVYSCLTRIPLS
mmetsp:Transcript_37808/g.90449  ORF Transcript_37808/g.90449 Transcript_37808/m.90449 type:complete len:85 (-) Transcript_37808:91-345(-)